MCCIREIQSYVHQIAESEIDYIRCNEVLKSSYFCKTNKSFDDLLRHCVDTYGEFQIEQRYGDPSYIWVWSESKECRDYIKDYIEYDLLHNWAYKYIQLDDGRISILFGRPSNMTKDGKRYNEWTKLFEWDDERKNMYFVNENGKKCQFTYKHINDSKKLNHQLCIIVNFKDYESVSEAKQAMEDVADRIHKSLNENIEIIDFFKEYQVVLCSAYFNDRIDSNILFDGDSDKLYVKHDDEAKYELFKAMLFEEIVSNTVILNDFEQQREVDVFRRLLIKKMDNLKYVQAVPYDDGRWGLVVYDERIQNEEFKHDLDKMIVAIRTNEIQSICIQKSYFPMILGPDGCHLQDILRECSLDCMDKSMIQMNRENGVFLFGGLHKTDERLQRFEALINEIINHCEVIDLSAKQWIHLSRNKSWQMINLQKEFGKCCLSLNYLTADKMLFYGPQIVKKQIIDRLDEAANQC